MEMILIFIAIYFAGIITTTLVSINKINEYEEETQAMYKLYRELKQDYEELKEVSMNAEQRALTHFRKLFAIENIIKKDEEKHEFITETMKKIKKELVTDRKSEN